MRREIETASSDGPFLAPSAIDAAIAASATLAVIYPHMTSVAEETC